MDGKNGGLCPHVLLRPLQRGHSLRTSSIRIPNLHDKESGGLRDKIFHHIRDHLLVLLSGVPHSHATVGQLPPAGHRLHEGSLHADGGAGLH